jgi:hypothetical protein
MRRPYDDHGGHVGAGHDPPLQFQQFHEHDWALQ